jgi:hypothetical protein
MARFPGYTFCDICAFKGNVWPIADTLKGECQAIVRFVQAINDVLGIPGEAKGVVIYASPDLPNEPIEGRLTEQGGPGMFQFPPDPKTGLKAFLFDAANAANNYEAALLFTFGKSYYYPGGIAGAALDSKLEVLHTFTKMSWARWDPVRERFVPVTLRYCYRPPC